MKLIDIYLCVIGATLLRFVVTDTTAYFVSCVLLGLVLGFWRGSRNE